jgi:hypothetical protein
VKRDLQPIAPISPPMAGMAQLMAGLARYGFLSLTREMAMRPVQPAPAWITLQEAAAHSGLSIAFLKRLIAAKRLVVAMDRPMKVRRADLDKLDRFATATGEFRREMRRRRG